MCIATERRPMIALLGLIAATLSSACTSDHESATGLGFYAEVAVAVEPHPGDPLARFRSGVGRSVIRWWYAPDPARWRWEFETVGTGIDDGVLLTVADGDHAWEYDDRASVYRRVFGRYASLGAEAMVFPLFSSPVGPVHAATVDEFMAQWCERGDEPEVALASETTLLDRRTQVVELHASGGVTRAFVDPERMFIMRWAVGVPDDGESYHAEVTALDYEKEIDDARFVFEPPPGAREAEPEATGACSGSSPPVGGAAFPAEPGFLAPA